MQQSLLATAAAAAAFLVNVAGAAGGEQECMIVEDVKVTFFGSPDNDPPGTANTAYDCGAGRDSQAAGAGSWENPLTFATAAEGAYDKCEVVYAPFLKKYIRHEDLCATCTRNLAQGIGHIDIWTGTVHDSGEPQIQCENNLTPGPHQSFIRHPASDLEVDLTPLWDDPKCNTGATYLDNDPSQYCGGGSGSGNSSDSPDSPDSSDPSDSPDLSDSPESTSPTCQTGCDWEGHCIGCACATLNDCSDDYICTDGRCTAS